jgi:hypothetical protein
VTITLSGETKINAEHAGDSVRRDIALQDRRDSDDLRRKLMGFLDQLKALWPLVMQAPWGFVPLAVAVLLAGWAVGRFMYNERP